MAEHNSLSELFSDIADAIRTKSGSSDAIVADDFPDAIISLPANVNIYGPYGPFSIGDTLSNAEKQALTFGALPNNPSISIVSDGTKYGTVYDYDGTTYSVKSGNASTKVSYTISFRSLTISDMTGAESLTWWRISPTLPR